MDIKKELFEAGTDVEAELRGVPLIFYCDKGNVNVTTDKFYHFEDWEEMIKAPIFSGLTFPEIEKELMLYF